MGRYQVTETETRRRTFGGRIVATLFYGFHVLMVLLTFKTEDPAGAILMVWLPGTVVLGVMMLCSQGERVVVREEERLDDEP